MPQDSAPTLEFRRAKIRHAFMEKAAAERGIHADKIESGADGAVDCHVEKAVPDMELYWSLEIGGEDKAAAEFCVWFKDNQERRHTCSFHLTYSGAYDTWEFGYQCEPDAPRESPRAKLLAAKAFGFKEPGAREVCEAAAFSIINALCAGFAAALTKKKKES